ncbi:MAG: DUF4145 domain-containing protein [Chromatiaceae bacterium]|nr:DUF4145 domain-containing protein [Chromatiaceae bacterium]
MNTPPFTPPAASKTAFNCPHCHAYANQTWGATQTIQGGARREIPNVWFVHCAHCMNYSIWVDKHLVFPEASMAPPPNPDLPADILGDYGEAAGIVSRSPRGAAALLRLSIQKLCGHLGESGKNINDDIAALVKKGLNPMIQQSLDVVRVIGNEAVHPGTIDLKDDTQTAAVLFNLVNVIAEATITQPKMIKGLYDSLPAEKRDQIAQRDKLD